MILRTMGKLLPFGAVVVLVAGCGISQKASKPPTPKQTRGTGATEASALPRTWHIGGFTLKEIPLPSDYFQKDNREAIVGTTLITMGAEPPYPVTWQSLTSKRTGTVVQDGCPENTLSAYADQNDGYNRNGAYAPGYAGFICVGRQKSQLVLVHVPSMKAFIFPLPGYSKSVQKNYGEYVLGAGIYGSPDHQYLRWEVDISESSNANLGSGIVDMTTGKSVASLPYPFNQGFVASPNGTLFRFNGHSLSKWNGKAFKALGTIPNFLGPIGNDGSVWAVRPSTANVFITTLIRETPGSTEAQSWTIVGGDTLYEPGFVAFRAGATGEGPIKILFPEAHRTLTFQNVWRQPMLSPFATANYQIITQADSEPVVIEVIPQS